jgi:hypothetical protein
MRTPGKRPPARSVPRRPDIDARIAAEIYIALERLDAGPELLVPTWNGLLRASNPKALRYQCLLNFRWDRGGETIPENRLRTCRMRPDFCIFTDSHDKQVAVNPQHVRCVQYNSVDSTRIEFDSAHHVTVKAGVIDVARVLRTSEN